MYRATLILALLSAAAAAAPAGKRSNVVVLLSDDLGYRDIGCYGGPVQTPTAMWDAAQSKIAASAME